MTTRADTHDLDKLRRWQKDLEATPSDAPPVFAVFLVSGDDRAAHNVFRAFRTSFEESNLGFSHLVIFGQHGVSETARRLRDKLGLEAEGGPLLVLFSGDCSQPKVVALPAGEGSDSRSYAGPGWQDALDQAITRIGEPETGKAAVFQVLKEICTELVSLN